MWKCRECNKPLELTFAGKAEIDTRLRLKSPNLHLVKRCGCGEIHISRGGIAEDFIKTAYWEDDMKGKKLLTNIGSNFNKHLFMFTIKEQLRKKGYRNATKWAKANGFLACEALNTINRYLNKPYSNINSPFVYKVLNQLYQDTGVNLMEPENGAERADKKMEEAL